MKRTKSFTINNLEQLCFNTYLQRLKFMHSEFNLEEVFRVISISIASCRVSNGKENYDIPIKLFHKIGEPIAGNWLSVCRENFFF